MRWARDVVEVFCDEGEAEVSVWRRVQSFEEVYARWGGKGIMFEE